MKRLLVTGSNGLVGSEMVRHFHRLGWAVDGIDNNMRADFFGPAGDTRWNQRDLQRDVPGFRHHELDIRDRVAVLALVDRVRPDAVIHTAAQPSHDLAARRPFDDFDVNAGGTLNLLEGSRQSCPESPFVFMSTNKVYGDGPNLMAVAEQATRWDFADPACANGVSEEFPIDRAKHSIFGASKVAADVMVQEYGRYFGLPTCCLRAGCITGPAHSAVELHGFLGYVVRVNVTGALYSVYGYGGKQVRDNIHACDVAGFAQRFIEAPRSGEVYNCGGGRQNSCSILEAFGRIEQLTGRAMRWDYVDRPRDGDHVCYISDLGKMKAHYPGWSVQKSLDDIFAELAEGWLSRTTELAVAR